MKVTLHSHALDRSAERGATEAEIAETVRRGQSFAAKFGRTGFRLDFPFGGIWRGKHYAFKQIEALAVAEEGGWLVITVLVKYF